MDVCNDYHDNPPARENFYCVSSAVATYRALYCTCANTIKVTYYSVSFAIAAAAVIATREPRRAIYSSFNFTRADVPGVSVGGDFTYKARSEDMKGRYTKKKKKKGGRQKRISTLREIQNKSSCDAT